MASHAPAPEPAPAESLSPGSRHEIPVRKPEFPFDADIPRHWMLGNPIATHVFNGLNLLFPEGERFFIRSVNDHLDAVEDPALRRQARAFAGQEAMHGREHERYFDTLRSQGYEIDTFLRRFTAFVQFFRRWLPASMRVAVTAGAEHYTATFGHFALEDPNIEEAHPTMRDLIWWHATEEIEHKAVAFDVMQAAGVSYPVRILGYLLATFSLFGWAAAGTRMLLRQDGLTQAERRTARDEMRQRRGDAAGPLLRQVLAYFRPGFHPNERDDLGLARHRLEGIAALSEAR